MTVMEVYDKSRGLEIMEELYSTVEDRLRGSTMTTCPVEFASSFIKLAASQSCGKCTPCRIGLNQLARLIDNVLDGYGFIEDLDLMVELAESIYASSDCAIGYESAAVALRSLKGFKDDYLFHIEHNDCGADSFEPVPCKAGCPAGVDIPGYIALVKAGRYSEALGLIRKDNPFSVVCGLVCEHPCEDYCRRAVMDDPINIRGIKRFANEQGQIDPLPPRAALTGKRVAIIGGGPSGLTCAYYLALMGHSPVIFEQRQALGGMLRYGIPAYRLPREELQAEVDHLLAAGVEVRNGVRVGQDISIQEITDEFDAVYLAIGAHSDNRLGLEGEDAQGIYSAVELLRKVGDYDLPDFSGKDVIIVGGGNVAMDAARTALRLGAKSSRIVYRRRVLDMTALPAEIEMARAEGCLINELAAPVAIQVADGQVSGLTVQPQIVSGMQSGRPVPVALDAEPYTIACDVMVVAIGQTIDSADFAAYGLPTNRGRIQALADASLAGYEGVFSGGDCVTGPASAVRAIAGGKAAARNIDSFLGFNHIIANDTEVPPALAKGNAYCARSNMIELVKSQLAGDFAITEQSFSCQEAMQESDRCLRCDHFGLSALRGGRALSW
ncbi:MAG: NAD(P)-binding protein [Coriobacteriia bacterium]|nr:NAD(P)-binding protein [Coriobacteriia bacterium]